MTLFLVGCNSNSNYFPLNKDLVLNYQIESFYEGSKKSLSKQTYTVIDNKNNESFVLGNGGQLVAYRFEKDGIKRKKIDYLKNEYLINIDGKIKKHKNFDLPNDKLDKETGHYVLKFPIAIGTSWNVRDLTRLKMKIGYDKVYETWLPYDLNYKIVEINKKIRIKNKVFKNCIKVIGKGNTSFNAGPPVGLINISVVVEDWYSSGVGLIKTTRVESSDSEIMGEIKTIKEFE